MTVAVRQEIETALLLPQKSLEEREWLSRITNNNQITSVSAQHL
ncbi:MAG: hypothetical protein ACRCT1_18885 [Microcoleaceae cyanobacterium]